MADYKAMYYYLAGRMETTLDALEATTNALVEIKEKLKMSQQDAEKLFADTEDDNFKDYESSK